MPTVTCTSIFPNSWTGMSPGETISNFGVDIWKIPVVGDELHLKHLRLMLQESELEKSKRYHQEKDRQRYVTSRAFLRTILSGYLNQPAKDIQFTIGLNKKPFLENQGNINVHYNISHSGEWILIAIGKNEIGIDVEKIDRSVLHEEIFPISFSDLELHAIKSSDVPAEKFYLCWTRKEALTKATAKGIDDDLKNIPCLDGAHSISKTISGSIVSWSVDTFMVDDIHIGSVAHDATEKNVRFLEAKL